MKSWYGSLQDWRGLGSENVVPQTICYLSPQQLMYHIKVTYILLLELKLWYNQLCILYLTY